MQLYPLSWWKYTTAQSDVCGRGRGTGVLLTNLNWNPMNNQEKTLKSGIASLAPFSPFLMWMISDALVLMCTVIMMGEVLQQLWTFGYCKCTERASPFRQLWTLPAAPQLCLGQHSFPDEENLFQYYEQLMLLSLSLLINQQDIWHLCIFYTELKAWFSSIFFQLLNIFLCFFNTIIVLSCKPIYFSTCLK